MGLKITRREGERVVIGGDIVIEVRRIEGRQVALTIAAPDDVEVWREELLDEDDVRAAERRAGRSRR